MPRVILRICLLIWLVLLTVIPPAVAATTVLPIKLDYSLIRSFFVEQAFTGPGESAAVIDEFDGCQFLKLQQPEIFPDSGDLRLKTQVTLKMGLPLLDGCQMPIEIDGVLDVRMRVKLDASGWTLRFQTEDLRFTTIDGKSAGVSANVMELVRERLFGHLDQVVVNLSTPIEELQTMLPLFFQPEVQPRITKWLQSIRPGKIEARPEFYSIELVMDVETGPSDKTPALAEKKLSSEEMDRFLRSWETWDAFLVYQIDRLGAFGLDDQERAAILQTLLETRYQLTEALASNQSAPGKDLVRTQFLTVWERFAPLLRKYLTRDPSVAPLSFLVYLSAGDALTTLDKLGPTLGLDISRDGLLRLARLMNDAGPELNLDYNFEVDPALREILGFGPPLAAPDRIFPDEDVDIDNLNSSASAQKIMLYKLIAWFDLSPRAAFAADQPPPDLDLDALKAWLVDTTNFDAYLQRVRSLLQEESANIVNTGKLPAERRGLFEKIIQATAWQESCFRQFTVKKGKMTYLRSWNNTSVGLMQINERVWRGLYRIDALRWDPKYNIQAGSEILRMYLVDYVLKDNAAKSLNEEGQTRAAYALYNSGPQNFKNFLTRHAKKDYYKSDTLFWEKYLWASTGQFDKLKVCLYGE